MWSVFGDVAIKAGAFLASPMPLALLTVLVITVLVLWHKGDKDVRVKFGPFEIDRRTPEPRESDRRELPPADGKGDDEASA